MSRTVLAGLVGKSPSWVKQVEGGQLQMPKLPMVLRIAEALRVQDLSELMGEQSVPTALFAGPGHARLPQVRAAIDAYPFVADHEAPSAAYMEARLVRTWRARHSSPNHRDVIGSLLPELIRDAQLGVRQSETAAERRGAQALLSQTYSLCQFFIAYQPDASLLWRVVERGMVAALESEDPHTLGVAAWLAAQAHRDSGPGHFEAADAVTLETLRYLEPLLPEAGDDVLAIAGALHFEAGSTAGCCGSLRTGLTSTGGTSTGWGSPDEHGPNQAAAALGPRGALMTALQAEDCLDYTPNARSVSLARRRTARLVADWGHPELAGDAALLASELATNALRHGCLRGRLFRVRVVLNARLCVSRSAIPAASGCRILACPPTWSSAGAGFCSSVPWPTGGGPSCGPSARRCGPSGL